MTGLTPETHILGSRGEAAEAKPKESMKNLQEEKIDNANSSVLCRKCTALTYQCMRISEASPDGQLHHENWKSLARAANLGCRLCTFFTVAALHPKSKPGHAFYQDQSGPIRLKIVETWKEKVVCLHMYVPQDRHPAVYYLYLTTGRPLRAYYDPL